jgi:hypothetical protein
MDYEDFNGLMDFRKSSLKQVYHNNLQSSAETMHIQ